MPFDYYRSLSPSKRAVYRQSDRVASLPLPDLPALRSLVGRLEKALDHELSGVVQRSADDLCKAICLGLGVRPVTVRVLSKRPRRSGEELLGIYQERAGRSAEITIWMRTAKKKRVVAVKTFLRTLLHELCHHLDYTLLDLRDSFHTQGFFRRESSLFSQLMPAESPTPIRKQETPVAAPRKLVQMKLPF